MFWSEYIQGCAQSLKEQFDQGGLNGVRNYLQANLNEWKSIPLNVAVIGSSGVGKSSFINTVLNLTAKDEGAAKVGVRQCTITPTSFCRPEYPNVKLWDLPGVGTPEFPRDTYLEQVNFGRYDFFLILSATRFTDHDLWLAEEVRSADKSFYFLRTKVDADIRGYVKSQGKVDGSQEDIDTVLKDIKEDCEEQLQSRNFPIENIFLIENYETTRYDFDYLFTKLVRDAPDIKRTTMAMCIEIYTKGFIKEKEKILEARIVKIAIASAIIAATPIPIPGLSLFVDGSAIAEEIIYYRKVLGLNEDRRTIVAEHLGLSLSDLDQKMKLATTAMPLTIRGIVTVCKGILLSEGIESVTKFAIPVVGGFIAGAVSYWSTGNCLRSFLADMVKDALQMNEQLTRLLSTHRTDQSQANTEVD